MLIALAKHLRVYIQEHPKNVLIKSKQHALLPDISSLPFRTVALPPSPPLPPSRLLTPGLRPGHRQRYRQ